MKLELFYSDWTGPMARISDIDYDYQAEQWVIDSRSYEENNRDGAWVVRWVLSDSDVERAVWERPQGDRSMPKLIRYSDRFTGVRL